MKKIIYLIVLANLLFTNCTHRIVRSGYDVNPSNTENCEVAITKSMSFNEMEVIKVGQIRLGETGFSVACSEAHAVEILRKEACSIDANLILITDEKRPDVLSSCYRCTANLYKASPDVVSNILQNNEPYQQNNLQQRVTNDRQKNTMLAVLGGVVGFVIGFMLVSSL